MQLALSNLTLT